MGLLDITGIGSIFDAIKEGLSLIPNTNEKAQIAGNLALEQLKDQFSLMQSQVDVNKVEAASPNLFIAGWRPFLGWACSFVVVFIPMATWIAGLLGVHFTFPSELYYTLSMLLGGMVGVRMYEKVQGVPDSVIKGRK